MSSREVNIRALQRSWARRPKFAVPLSPADAQAQYSCPTCGSENTQRLSTAYMAGVSQFSAVTSGFGWAGGPAGGERVDHRNISNADCPDRCPAARSEVIVAGFLLTVSFSFHRSPAPFALLETSQRRSFRFTKILRPCQFWESELCAFGFPFGLSASGLHGLQQAGVAETSVEWHRYAFLCLQVRRE